jgi:hypothetical protein
MGPVRMQETVADQPVEFFFVYHPVRIKHQFVHYLFPVECKNADDGSDDDDPQGHINAKFYKPVL